MENAALPPRLYWTPPACQWNLSEPSPSRSSRIRTFVARSPTGFSHDESEGERFPGLLWPRRPVASPMD